MKELGPIFNYEDRIKGRFSLTATTTSHFVYGDAVPAGEVWIITAICAWNNSGATNTLIACGAYDGTNFFALDQVAAPARFVPATYHGCLVLKEGDKVCGYFAGVATGDALLLRYWGYKMRVD